MNKTIYQQRRQQLLKNIGDNDIAIIFSGEMKLRNPENHYPFRQDNDFYYLTGFNEANAVAVILPNHDEGEFILFNEPYDPQFAIWMGHRTGLDGAKSEFGADQAFSIHDIDEKLSQLLNHRDTVYYNLGCDNNHDHDVMAWVKQLTGHARRGINPPTHFANVSEMIAEMRLLKESHEVDLMRTAAQISAKAHCRAMQQCRPNMTECQLEGELLYEFYQNDCRNPAYGAIVAGGNNACVLHYTENNALLNDGDLVLIDAGVEYENYAADITRTFPVNGKFTGEQRAVYEVVLHTQTQMIATIKPGIAWDELQQQAVKIITAGMVEIGLLNGSVEENIEKETYKNFYMHNLSHWLGMDVHDVGRYRVGDNWRQIQANMVLTVEPGIYIKKGAENVDEKWQGIGIRIEDDVLITENGTDVLSKDVPKDVDAIEALMAEGK